MSAMTNVGVRRATGGDLAGILDIYNEAVLHTTATYDCEPQTMEQRAAWFQEHQQNNYPVFVATGDGDRMLGWSALSPYRSRPGYRFTAENSVYVAVDQRGRGIGRLLMAPLIKAARARGLHAILAAIDAQNQASIRLHAAFGFAPAGLLKQVGFKFGRWLDVLLMERML
jgi:phosphinothricin acetyltransferase